jgi:hypothetical protein
MNLAQKVEIQKDQATSLRLLVGKFSGNSRRLRHRTILKRLINCLRDERVVNAQIKKSNSYLLDQISERDLMLEDCYETMIQTQNMVSQMEDKINQLKSENQKLKSFKGLEVVA